MDKAKFVAALAFFTLLGGVALYGSFMIGLGTQVPAWVVIILLWVPVVIMLCWSLSILNGDS